MKQPTRHKLIIIKKMIGVCRKAGNEPSVSLNEKKSVTESRVVLVPLSRGFNCDRKRYFIGV